MKTRIISTEEALNLLREVCDRSDPLTRRFGPDDYPTDDEIDLYHRIRSAIGISEGCFACTGTEKMIAHTCERSGRQTSSDEYKWSRDRLEQSENDETITGG